MPELLRFNLYRFLFPGQRLFFPACWEPEVASLRRIPRDRIRRLVFGFRRACSVCLHAWYRRTGKVTKTTTATPTPAPHPASSPDSGSARCPPSAKGSWAGCWAQTVCAHAAAHHASRMAGGTRCYDQRISQRPPHALPGGGRAAQLPGGARQRGPMQRTPAGVHSDHVLFGCSPTLSSMQCRHVVPFDPLAVELEI